MLGLSTAHLAQALVDDRRRAATSSVVARHAVVIAHAIAEAHERERRNVALSLLLVEQGDQK